MKEACDKCGRPSNAMTLVKHDAGVFGRVCGECKARAGTMFGGKPGWVYVIGFGEFWKCGRTTRDPNCRLRDMQTGNPEPLRVLVKWMVGDCGTAEAIAHARLFKFHYRGEWFKGSEGQILAALGIDCKPFGQKKHP
jgi:hypothetical protein